MDEFISLVFVYGTLRQGESNHELLKDSELLGLFETKPEYALSDLGEYPGLRAGNDRIVGEVYRITEQTLVQLDRLEDEGFEYRRETIETAFGLAWFYIYQGHHPGTLITSGNWLNR